MTSQKRKQFIKGSRIREPDIKNAEYYVGDYFTLPKYKRSPIFKLFYQTIIHGSFQNQPKYWARKKKHIYFLVFSILKWRNNNTCRVWSKMKLLFIHFHFYFFSLFYYQIHSLYWSVFRAVVNQPLFVIVIKFKKRWCTTTVKKRYVQQLFKKEMYYKHYGTEKEE